MSEQVPRMIVPIYKNGDNRFFVCLSDYVGADENEAKDIGAIKCFLSFDGMWATHTGKVLDVTGGTPHRRADVAGTSVAFISGPFFDEAVAASAD